MLGNRKTTNNQHPISIYPPLQFVFGISMELINILLADNENSNLKALMRTLREDYNIFTATNIEDISEIMYQNEIVLVLLNYRMPGIDNLEALETIFLKYPDTIYIILVAYSDEEKAENALKSGHIFSYITKPWEPEEVKASVREGVEAYELKNAFSEPNARVLFDGGIISRDELQIALNIQRNELIPLNEVLLKYSMVSKDQVDMALKLQNTDGKKFEDALIEIEAIFPDDLSKAKELQKHERRKLTKIILDLGYASEDDIYSCYSSSLGMPYIPLSLFVGNLEPEQKLSKELILKHGIVPVDIVGKILVLAASEPLSNRAKREIEQETGYRIMSFCASHKEIEAFLMNTTG